MTTRGHGAMGRKGRGDGQELRQALDGAEDDGLQELRHKVRRPSFALPRNGGPD
jgi:hypothetical protein